MESNLKKSPLSRQATARTAWSHAGYRFVRLPGLIAIRMASHRRPRSAVERCQSIWKWILRKRGQNRQRPRVFELEPGFQKRRIVQIEQDSRQIALPPRLRRFSNRFKSDAAGGFCSAHAMERSSFLFDDWLVDPQLVVGYNAGRSDQPHAVFNLFTVTVRRHVVAQRRSVR